MRAILIIVLCLMTLYAGFLSVFVADVERRLSRVETQAGLLNAAYQLSVKEGR
jgi:hypothetical protein